MTTSKGASTDDGPVITLDILFMMTGLGLIGYWAVQVVIGRWGVVGAALGAWIGFRYMMSKQGY